MRPLLVSGNRPFPHAPEGPEPTQACGSTVLDARGSRAGRGLCRLCVAYLTCWPSAHPARLHQLHPAAGGTPAAGPLVPCTEPPPSWSPKCLQHAVFSGPRAGEGSPAFPTPENSTDGSESVSGPGGLKWNRSHFLTRIVLYGKGDPGHWLDRKQVHWLQFPVWTPGLKEERRKGGQVLGTGLLAPPRTGSGGLLRGGEGFTPALLRLRLLCFQLSPRKQGKMIFM